MNRLARRDPNLGRGPWCSVCNKEKYGDNHWFEIHHVADALVLRPLGAGVMVLAPGHNPLCGEGCMLTRVSEWMSEQARMPSMHKAMAVTEVVPAR
jgi:hypothetical protein